MFGEFLTENIQAHLGKFAIPVMFKLVKLGCSSLVRFNLCEVLSGSGFEVPCHNIQSGPESHSLQRTPTRNTQSHLLSLQATNTSIESD